MRYVKNTSLKKKLSKSKNYGFTENVSTVGIKSEYLNTADFLFSM